MKKFLAALVATSVILSGCASLAKPNPSTFLPSPPRPVLDVVTDSVARFSIVLSDGREAGSCTAFSIAPRKFMTAAHCVGNITDMWGNQYETKFKVGTKWAVVTNVDENRDLAVVVADEVRPALGFREDPLTMFEEVTGVGYGYGFTKPLYTPNRVNVLDFVIKIEGHDSWPGTLFMGTFIGGMSGGPIVDKNGAVVGIVQAGGDQIGFGVPVSVIKDFLDPDRPGRGIR